MDIIYIKALQVETLIGVHAWERQVRQVLVLDIDMAFDIRKAAASDDLPDTLDYSAVSERLRAFLQSSRFHLIEAAAEQCADILLREFPVAGCRLQLAKPGAVPQAHSVGVVIERGVMCG